MVVRAYLSYETVLAQVLIESIVAFRPLRIGIASQRCHQRGFDHEVKRDHFNVNVDVDIDLITSVASEYSYRSSDLAIGGECRVIAQVSSSSYMLISSRN